MMVVAKSPAAERDLAEQLRAADMLDMSSIGKKLYVALLLGHPGGPQKQSCITASGNIGRDPKNAKMWTVTPAGKPAKTIFRVHASSKKHGVSLVTAELFSGRTHQIRVHAACLGAPVANDKLYASLHQPKAFQAFRQQPFCQGLSDKRQLLHAFALNIDHPVRDRGERARLRLRAPVPHDMANIIGQVWPDLSIEPGASWPNWPAGFEPQTESQDGMFASKSCQPLGSLSFGFSWFFRLTKSTICSHSFSKQHTPDQSVSPCHFSQILPG